MIFFLSISTHIVKTGSDVVYELFEVLPRLRSGVVVHFHDVFYPFEYPREWVLVRNYSWNELYALRAFLMGNHDWEIMFFNDYFVRTERARVERDAPEILMNSRRRPLAAPALSRHDPDPNHSGSAYATFRPLVSVSRTASRLTLQRWTPKPDRLTRHRPSDQVSANTCLCCEQA